MYRALQIKSIQFNFDYMCTRNPDQSCSIVLYKDKQWNLTLFESFASAEWILYGLAIIPSIFNVNI